MIADVHLFMALALSDGTSSHLMSKAVRERRAVRATLVVNAAVEALARPAAAIRSADQLLSHIDQRANDPAMVRMLAHDLRLFEGPAEPDTEFDRVFKLLFTLGLDPEDVWPSKQQPAPPMLVLAPSPIGFPPPALSHGAHGYKLMAAMVASPDASFFGATWRGVPVVFRGARNEPESGATLAIGKQERVQAFHRWKSLWEHDVELKKKRPCASYVLTRDWTRELPQIQEFCMTTCGKANPLAACPPHAPLFHVTSQASAMNVYVYVRVGLTSPLMKQFSGSQLPTLASVTSGQTGSKSRSLSKASRSLSKAASGSLRKASRCLSKSASWSLSKASRSLSKANVSSDIRGELFQCELKVADLEYQLNQQHDGNVVSESLKRKLPAPRWL